ncbi:MAG: GMC family oxidoreductase [Kofleriaceae bacterium]|nr:GMC family oxidoreductase [Kofleriaceae bacterium]
MPQENHDTDVLIIGSGFGGSVAALRFAEAGKSVVILERGPHITRDTNQVDLDALWIPGKHRYGPNDLQSRGKNIVPWLGAGVGGGSHVYAGTMKRAASFEGFPEAIVSDDMGPYYQIAENMMDTQYYPDYSPYSDVRATQLFYNTGEILKEKYPDIVEDWGPIHLAISFAPDGGTPGEEFINKHGAKQRYSDPKEQSLLGGDIDAKNTLDKNYLHLAEKEGASIRPLSQAEKIEPLPNGGYRVHYKEFVQETGWAKFRRNWLRGKARDTMTSVTCETLVLAAGSIGSTELLLNSRDRDKSLPNLSKRLGESYSTNGDFISLLFPFRGLSVSWLGLALAIAGLVLWKWWLLAPGAAAYYLGLAFSRRAFDPDIGTTNSDFIRFKARDGSTQGAYIESGRYPTPIRLVLAIVLSSLGLWRPRHYGKIVTFTKILRLFVPPFALLARSWPIPMLKMGKDDALGTFRLEKGRVVIDFDLSKNTEFYQYLDDLGKIVAKSSRSIWAPNIMFKLTKRLEVPHNQGGVPMGEDTNSGVVDHAGRVFGYENLLVLDGAIFPISPGPNPALTILAICERAMVHILKPETSVESTDDN